MYPSVRREIPDFITQYVVFCDIFIDHFKKKTCLVLTRNLKFLEFHQKQLMSIIDLSETCFHNVQNKIRAYEGPKSNMFISASPGGQDNRAARAFDSLSISTTTSTGISDEPEIRFGKYVFQSLNSIKVYLIIQCWENCVILQRLPDFKGFQVKAQYNEFVGFKIIHGPIKYCPVLEIQLQDTTIKTDFEENNFTLSTLDAFTNKKPEIKKLLDRVRSAKTELQIHKTITAHTFECLQNRLNYGLPGERSIKLEEKQKLARCGDIWKRFTAQNDLVIGIPLVNQCSPPNFSILHNIRLILQPIPCPINSITIMQRLFQLKQSFEQLDSIETFLQTEDEQIQANVYVKDSKYQLLPESYSILVAKFKTSQIINLKQCPLLLSYEVRQEHNSNVTVTQMQIFLQELDLHGILYGQREKYELNFRKPTLYQDLLTIAISSSYIKLEIVFNSFQDVEIYKSCLTQKFDFDMLQASNVESWFNSLFYNQRRSSLWFGTLILSHYKSIDNEDCHCATTWKIYCPDQEKVGVFIKLLLNDLVAMQCNILDIGNKVQEKSDRQQVAQFEEALRLELCAIKQLANESKSDINKWSISFADVCKKQFKSDEMIKSIKENGMI